MRASDQRPFAADSKGFTLVEVLIAMAIAGIVMGSIYSIFISSNRSYRTQDSVADAQQRVRVGIDFIAHDLRLAGLDPIGPATDAIDGIGAGIKLATASQIRFTMDTDMDGAIENANSERLTYVYNSGAGELSRILYEGTGSQSTQLLIDGVSSLSFSYLNADGVALAVPVSAADLAAIRMVDIAMTCQGADAQGNPISRTLTTRVICRNLYM